jgi:two-component sensor histidine kinase/putative methionine-R-sulfoxide reductase with GAF domain
MSKYIQNPEDKTGYPDGSSANDKGGINNIDLLYELDNIDRKLCVLKKSIDNHQTYAESLERISKEINCIKADLNSAANIADHKNSTIIQEHSDMGNYKNFKQYEKESAYENIINTIATSVHKSLKLSEVLENAVDVMNKHIKTAQNVSIYMVESDSAILQAFRGYPEDLVMKLAEIPYPKGFTWKTINDCKPLYCPDVDKDTYIGPMGRKLGTKSYVSMPIRYSGKAIGVININSYKKFAFEKEELNLLGIVAKQIETAVKNAKQAEELRESQIALEENIAKLERKSRYEHIINTVITSVHQTLELYEVFENAVEAMSKHIESAQNVCIYMVESDFAVLKTYCGYRDHMIRKISKIPYPKGLIWKTIIEGEPIHCPDVDKDPYIGPIGKELGTKSYVSMPIRGLGKAIGCINISSNEKYAFDEEELSLLEIIGKQIETAINNANQTLSLRKSEEALRKIKDDLEERVNERTSELQRANRLLIKEVLERRCIESELKQSLNEKDVLFKEIHHRVKNNLQIISSLLNLQSRQIKDPEAVASFNESKNRIRSIATLHEQLYRSKDLSNIDFTAYLHNITNYLLHSYGAGSGYIKVVVNAERIYLDLSTAIPCGLIVNELVSNAITHGFPRGERDAVSTPGEIKIDFKKSGDKYFLSVSNNGVRFPNDLDINKSSTLGLELVSSLSRQLRGKISLNREEITEFKLVFAA